MSFPSHYRFFNRPSWVKSLATGGVLVWALLTAVAVTNMTREVYTPGETHAPRRWPKESALALDPAKPTVMIFLHPGCLCSEASVGELANLMTAIGAGARVLALFYQPLGEHEEWRSSALRSHAQAIFGVEVLTDTDGVEARRFGVETSGTVLVYSPQGENKFSGGITAARGEWGQNNGERAVAGWVNGGAEICATPVFGCGLLNPQWPRPGRSR